MHPILPFYAALSLFALFGLRLEHQYARKNIRIAAWGSMGVVLLAAIFRELSGDTWRYYFNFEQMASLSFAEMWSATNNNWLFMLLNWGLAQIGTNPLWLFLPVTLFCIFMMRFSLGKLLNSTDTAIAILLYSAYPFFIFYVSSGIKQAIAMALLFQGYVALSRGYRKEALVWLILAPLFHSGALLVYPFVAIHYFLWRPFLGYRRVIWVSILLLIGSVALSVTGLNQVLMAPVQSFAEFESSYDIYFTEASLLNYRAGFRLDFMFFSLLPYFAAWWLSRKGRGLNLETSGWWLNLYTLLNCIYHLFAFAPFSDRFAAFSWYLIPAILLFMLRDTGSLDSRRTIIAMFAFLNILILQFYTGPSIRVAF